MKKKLALAAVLGLAASSWGAASGAQGGSALPDKVQGHSAHAAAGYYAARYVSRRTGASKSQAEVIQAFAQAIGAGAGGLIGASIGGPIGAAVGSGFGGL